MSLFRLHIGYTERRRRMLRRNFDRLDRLESRTQITEPISLVGVATNALRNLIALGFMYPDGANRALNMLAPAKDAVKKPGGSGRTPYALPAKLLKSIDAVAIGQIAGAGGSSAAEGSGAVGRHSGSEASNDWLSLSAKPTSDQGNDGVSKPWHPAKGPSGGPAQALRGGTSASRGTQNTARGIITPLRLPASTPAASAGGGASAALLAAVAGASGAGTQVASPGAAGAAPVPGISLVHAGRCFRGEQPGRRRWCDAQPGYRPGVDSIWRQHAASGFDARPGDRQLRRVHTWRFCSVWSLRAG